MLVQLAPGIKSWIKECASAGCISGTCQREEAVVVGNPEFPAAKASNKAGHDRSHLNAASTNFKFDL